MRLHLAGAIQALLTMLIAQLRSYTIHLLPRSRLTSVIHGVHPLSITCRLLSKVLLLSITQVGTDRTLSLTLLYGFVCYIVVQRLSIVSTLSHLSPRRFDFQKLRSARVVLYSRYQCKLDLAGTP